MLIIGAKGFAKEVLEVVCQRDSTISCVFFDNVSTNLLDKLYGKYPIINDLGAVKKYFKKVTNKFVLGIGNPKVRFEMATKFTELGGELEQCISPFANIGNFGNHIGKGVNIMTGTVLTNDITIGDGCLINLNCTIGHDTIIGNYCELSPGTHISGRCTLGNFCNIGTGSVILPKITIGNKTTVGAGAVVTKDIPDNATVVGIPAKPLN